MKDDDAKTWLMLIALFTALILYFKYRKKPVERADVRLNITESDMRHLQVGGMPEVRMYPGGAVTPFPATPTVTGAQGAPWTPLQTSAANVVPFSTRGF